MILIKDYQTFGRHIILDVWGVDFSLLNDVDFLQSILKEASEKCGVTVLGVDYKLFEPHGCTVYIILSESHLSIHTYPEKGFAGIDCFTCGNTVDPNIAIDYILMKLKPIEAYHKTLIRGNKHIDVLD